MPSIFELNKEQEQLNKLIQSGELSQEEAADTLEGMEDERHQKIDSYCHVINKLTMQLEAITNEKARYATLEAEKKNEIKRVKQTLMYGLQGLGERNFDTGHFKGHIRKGSESVEINNLEKVPSQFVETVISEKPDKAAIKLALKAGDIVPGCSIKVGDPSLTIK